MTEIRDVYSGTSNRIVAERATPCLTPSSAAACPSIFSASAAPPALSPLERIAHADRFFAATGADIRNGGTKAYHGPSQDYVQMPSFETFRDAESHAATLAHELTHWTRHDRRLARDFGRVKHGDEGSAREELVAELVSAFLCADLGITPEIREDHATYIGNWLTVLKNDKRLIFSAAAHAQRRRLPSQPAARGDRGGGVSRRPDWPSHGARSKTLAMWRGRPASLLIWDSATPWPKM